MKGFAGKQLRINLDGMEAHLEDISPELTRQFLGGAGYGAKII